MFEPKKETQTKEREIVDKLLIREKEELINDQETYRP